MPSGTSEPTVLAGTRWGPLGYGLVAVASLLVGAIGTIPFLILGYVADQWLLAPVGLAVADSSNNDGPEALIVAGVLGPLVVVLGWAALVRWISRAFALSRCCAWPLAAVSLGMPVVLFIVAKA